MSDLDFDPNLFQPEILARLPIEVKIALVDLTRASVEAASLTKGNKHPTLSQLRRLDELSDQVAKAALAYGRALLKAAGQ